MNTFPTPFLLSILFVVIGCTIATAQSTETPPPDNHFWAFYSAGITTLGPGMSMGIGADISHHTFSIRTSATDTDPFRDTWDIGFMYGRSTYLGSYYASGGAGFAIVAGEQYSKFIGGTPMGTMETMYSFPVEGRISRPLTSFLSIGLYAFANVNTNQPFGGLTASLRLGRIQ